MMLPVYYNSSTVFFAFSEVETHQRLWQIAAYTSPISTIKNTMRAPYLLALCEAARQSNVTFGVATQLGTQSSTFNVDAVTTKIMG